MLLCRRDNRSMLISDAAELFILSRASEGAAKNTLKGYRVNLNHLERCVGRKHVSALTVADIDSMFAELSPRLSDASINHLMASLSSFFKWCRSRGHMDLASEPLAGRRRRRLRRVERRRLTASQFPMLLAAAPHPRDRMLLALGLYLMLRASEIVDLRVGDVNLDAGEVNVRIFKTRDADVMPISAELDRELRTWLTCYTEECGPLRSDWYLIPQRSRSTTRGYAGRIQSDWRSQRLLPDQRLGKVEGIAQQALTSIGWDMRDTSGKSLWEGMHTLRRSGARALFDELVAQGYDGALRTVQTFLHHANSVMTERYLGLELDRNQRNQKFAGQPMFPSQEAGNVTVLREAHG